MTTKASPVISLRGIGKRYDSFASPGHRLLEKLDGRSRAAFSTWAVQDIDLDVMRGEAVGIMGRNGIRQVDAAADHCRDHETDERINAGQRAGLRPAGTRQRDLTRSLPVGRTS